MATRYRGQRFIMHSVSQVAEIISRQTGCRITPKMISDLLYYHRPEGIDEIQVISGRRLIPTAYIETIISTMRRVGKLPAEPAAI